MELTRVALRGHSMWPLLQSGDVLLVAPSADYRKGDIALFRDGEEWLAHRVVWSGPQLQAKGDRALRLDCPLLIPVGRVQGFERNHTTFWWGERALPGQSAAATLSLWSRGPRIQRWPAQALLRALSLWQSRYCVGQQPCPPPPPKARLVRELATLYVLRSLDKEFAQAQIPLWLMKGPALAHRYYSDPLARNYTDVDLFTQAPDWPRALALLTSLGAIPLTEPRWKGDDFRQNFSLHGATVEMHGAVLVDRPIDGAWAERSRPTTIAGLSWICEPCAEDLFVYLAGHGALQHLFDDYTWLIDLAKIAEQETNLDWEYVAQRARAFKLVAAVSLSNTLLRRDFSLALPPMGKEGLSKLLAFFLTKRRLQSRQHRHPRWAYLFCKALVRDSWQEILFYSWHRLRRR